MRYWLLKSEPDAYSIDDLAHDGEACWEGVRAYPARNNLLAMRPRDLALYYHSNVNPPAVVGIAEVVKKAYPDHHAFDPEHKYYDPRSNPAKPRWFMPDVRFVEKFPNEVPLAQIKKIKALRNMDLVKWGRLSVQRVKKREWDIVCALGRGTIDDDREARSAERANEER